MNTLRGTIPELDSAGSELIAAAAEAGIQMTVTSTLRSHAEQTRLFKRFVSGASKFPALPPGMSPHEYGFAFDAVCSPIQYTYDVGDTWRSWGGIWGGEKDYVHFEYPGFVAPKDDVPDGVPSVIKIGDFMLSFVPTVGWVMLGATIAKETPLSRVPLLGSAADFWSGPLTYSYEAAQRIVSLFK